MFSSKKSDDTGHVETVLSILNKEEGSDYSREEVELVLQEMSANNDIMLDDGGEFTFI